MEINRSNRTDGKWNDLPLRPSPSGALDAISGYIVEYGGWDIQMLVTIKITMAL